MYNQPYLLVIEEIIFLTSEFYCYTEEEGLLLFSNNRFKGFKLYLYNSPFISL
jgi:hypothetical protein